MNIDENRISSEIMRIAGGRIFVAMLICTGVGFVLGAVIF